LINQSLKDWTILFPYNDFNFGPIEAQYIMLFQKEQNASLIFVIAATIKELIYIYFLME